MGEVYLELGAASSHATLCSCVVVVFVGNVAGAPGKLVRADPDSDPGKCRQDEDKNRSFTAEQQSAHCGEGEQTKPKV